MRLGFLLLMGLPSSGKTTLAKSLSKGCEHQFENTCHFIHICYDELIPFSNGNYEYEWKSSRISLTKNIERFVVALKGGNVESCPCEFKSQFDTVSGCKSDVVLILDDNMYFRSMRYSLFQIARKQNIGFCQVFLRCTLENSKLKNNTREPAEVVPPHVIENMHSKIEPPNLKNTWERYSLELEAFSDLNEMHCKIFPVVMESLSNFMYSNDNFEMRELSKIQCRKSVLHQTDIALRKIIGLKMRDHLEENSSVNCKEYITGLNSRKSEILSDIKMGTICLPENILDEINSETLEKFHLINFLGTYF